MVEIFTALDFDSRNQAIEFASRLDPAATGVKVGKQLYTAAGPVVVEMFQDRGFKVFLDLKFHDIPNTVAGAVGAAAGLGVHMLTVHCSGGPSMLEAAGEAARFHRGGGPKIIGVTMLTSLNQGELNEVFGPDAVSIPDTVRRMTRLAATRLLDGVVCSGQEIKLVRSEVDWRGFFVVVPGVRKIDPDAPPDDQKRVMTAAEAVRLGATHLVIGRPITAAPDPLAALRYFREQADTALSSPSE